MSEFSEDKKWRRKWLLLLVCRDLPQCVFSVGKKLDVPVVVVVDADAVV